MSTDLSEYQSLLGEAYRGEVFGDAFFETMAGRQPDPDRREKLQTLQTVEARMAQSLRRLAGPAKVLGGEDKAKADGRELAEALDPEDWQAFVTGLNNLLPDFLTQFERLYEIADTPKDPALTALVNHEKAIQRFAQLELAGDSEKSLKPLQDHLRKPA